MAWAAMNPNSSRAQTSAVLYDLQSHRPRLAAARLNLALPEHPNDVQISLNLISAECRLGIVSPSTLIAARKAMGVDRAGGDVVFNWFEETLPLVKEHTCHGLDYADLQDMLNYVGTMPLWRDHVALRINLFHMRGSLALAEDKPKEALRAFDYSLAQMPQPATALRQAAALATAGFPELGLTHLDYFESLPPRRVRGYTMVRIHAWVLHQQGWWKSETAHLRKTLEDDAASKVAGGAIGA